MNPTGEPVQIGGGAPRIEMGLDADGNGSIDEVASLAAEHCGEVLGDPTWSRADAASVAGLLLTTEVMVAEAPKEEADHPPMGGGMGGMGGMDM